MITTDCPKCTSSMKFDSSSGTFICTECGSKVSVTALDKPQLGSYKKSVYYPEKADKNICEINTVTDENLTKTDKKSSSDISGITSDNFEVIPCRISSSDALKRYKKWSRHGIFSPHLYNKEAKKKGLELRYVPSMVYSITGHGTIELTGSRINEQVKSKERRIATDYYGIRRKINTNYRPYPQYSDKAVPGPVIMNSISDYSYDNMSDIQSITSDTEKKGIELYLKTYNDTSFSSIKLSDSIVNVVLTDTESELNNLVSGYSSLYTESIDTDYTINSSTPVLEPVWTLIHEHGETENNFYMNAQTGTIYGRPLISRPRIFSIIVLISLILSLIASFAAYTVTSAANEYNISINDIEPVIDDTADIFSDYEEVSILDYANKQKAVTGYQYIFVTTDSSTYSNKEYELQSLYSRLKNDINAPGTVLFLIGSGESSYECALQGYREAKDYIPRDVCDNIEASLQNNADSAYNMTISLFDTLDKVNDGTYVIDASLSDSTHIIPLIVLIVLISISLSSAFIALTAYKKKKNPALPALEHNTSITEKQDIYLRTCESVYKLS